MGVFRLVVVNCYGCVWRYDSDDLVVRVLIVVM